MRGLVRFVGALTAAAVMTGCTGHSVPNNATGSPSSAGPTGSNSDYCAAATVRCVSVAQSAKWWGDPQTLYVSTQPGWSVSASYGGVALAHPASTNVLVHLYTRKGAPTRAVSPVSLVDDGAVVVQEHLLLGRKPRTTQSKNAPGLHKRHVYVHGRQVLLTTIKPPAISEGKQVRTIGWFVQSHRYPSAYIEITVYSGLAAMTDDQAIKFANDLQGPLPL